MRRFLSGCLSGLDQKSDQKIIHTSISESIIARDLKLCHNIRETFPQSQWAASIRGSASNRDITAVIFVKQIQVVHYCSDRQGSLPTSSCILFLLGWTFPIRVYMLSSIPGFQLFLCPCPVTLQVLFSRHSCTPVHPWIGIQKLVCVLFFPSK